MWPLPPMNRPTRWSLPLTSPSKLATVIARLDIRRAQVLVEAIIVEVQDGNGLNLGVQWANKTLAHSNLPIRDYRF